jgi:glycerol-3-phosphate dehydrogenase
MSQSLHFPKPPWRAAPAPSAPRNSCCLDRSAALEALAKEHFDVAVIGAGITGAGVALDAASRGLKVALVDKGDIASGTSSNSSKLVHGGLRYLQQHDVGLVYESLLERQRLLQNAPHLVSPLPFLIPLFASRSGGTLDSAMVRTYSAALWAYDLTGGIRIGRLHRKIGGREVSSHFPTLQTGRLAAGFLYFDARADDARLALTVARTAADFGAVVATYCPVVGLAKEGPRVTGIRVSPFTTVPSPAQGPQNVLEVSASCVVNATGVWADAVAAMAQTRDVPPLRPAKGVHLTVPADVLPCDIAAVLPVKKDRRSIFVIPWGTHTYVGTTDTDYEGPLDDPRCSREDMEYLLSALNDHLDRKVLPEEVTSAWAGLRPLLAPQYGKAVSARTADLSRRHQVTLTSPGLVTVTGGKLTTYRKMAEDTMGKVLRELGEPSATGSAKTTNASPTRRLPLHGASKDRPGQGGSPGSPSGSEQKGRAGFSPGLLHHLASRYGTSSEEVLELIAQDPSLAKPLVEGLPYLRAEAVYAVSCEEACTLEDVLARRTRSLYLDARASIASAEALADLLAPRLGWDQAEKTAHLEAFLSVASRFVPPPGSNDLGQDGPLAEQAPARIASGEQP